MLKQFKLKLSILSILILFINGIYAQNVTKKQKKNIGKSIDKIEFTDYLKNEPKDKNFNNKFKVLEFWATWCKGCLEAVPHLNKLKSEFIDQDDLVFISVTYEAPEKCKYTLENTNFETIVVSDQSKTIHKKLKIEHKGMMVLPRTVLIDNTNTIIWYGTPNQLNKKLILKFLNGD